MPSERAHLALADRNQTVIDHLLQRPDECMEWIVTVAFYKALHLVEALFAHDGLGHGQSHENRDYLLKTNRRYAHIYRHYRPLWAASMVARYLYDPAGGTYSTFADYLPPGEAKRQMVDHRLHQIEMSVAKLLKS